jgi:hypothetical protein
MRMSTGCSRLGGRELLILLLETLVQWFAISTSNLSGLAGGCLLSKGRLESLACTLALYAWSLT